MKKLLASASIAATYLIPLKSAFADTVVLCDEDSQFANLCNLKFTDVVGDFIVLAFIVAIILALGFLIYGGLRWILAGGDKTQIEGARETIVGAIIGLVIVFLAYFILNILFQFFTGNPLNELTLPEVGAG